MSEANTPRSGSTVGSGCSVGTDPTAVVQGVQWVHALNSVLRIVEELPYTYEWSPLRGRTSLDRNTVLSTIREAIEKAQTAPSHGGEGIHRTH